MRHTVSLWIELPWVLCIPEGIYEIAGYGPNSLQVIQGVTKCTILPRSGGTPAEVRFVRNLTDERLAFLSSENADAFVSREPCCTIIRFHCVTEMSPEEARNESTASFFVALFFSLVNKLLAAYVVQSGFAPIIGYARPISIWDVRHIVISIDPEAEQGGFPEGSNRLHAPVRTGDRFLTRSERDRRECSPL